MKILVLIVAAFFAILALRSLAMGAFQTTHIHFDVFAVLLKTASEVVLFDLLSKRLSECLADIKKHVGTIDGGHDPYECP